ncbi:SUF system NifU family Fe-S cluster assembly protein [Phragmitibacter flavus]|uniref:SUF system NifU family Fe-S cluster assembly protein n=1 Tax=Phragmitibacter flavus TaxID=2576071 RepID=A0A5R8KF96_9BACT|nr:SUF system NifU family Fe-S cluster assembly protein [Phragmitibacter flavus]TLD70978.1 SUF system NifU family Fe-S cluster assembly protein [Phragmitibacter flavus]
MNPDLEDLYQQVILDHSRRPRNFGEIPPPVIQVHGDNPSCGDEIQLFVKFADDGSIEDIKFTGQGCAISQASASMMTLKTKGKSREEVTTLLAAFHHLLTHHEDEPAEILGDVQLLQSVWKFPQRVKCATLAWRSLEQALATDSASDASVTTEAGPG